MGLTKAEKELNNLDLHSLPVTLGNFTNSCKSKIIEGKLVAHFLLDNSSKGFDAEHWWDNQFSSVFDTECNLTRLSFLSSRT